MSKLDELEKYLVAYKIGRITLEETIRLLKGSEQQVRLEEREAMKKMVEGKIIPCIGNPEMMQSLEERLRNATLADILNELNKSSTLNNEK